MFERRPDRLSRTWRRSALVAVVTIAVLVVGASQAAAARQLRGVALHSLWAENSDRDMIRELNLARAAGSNVVRVDVAWASLEPRRKRLISQWYLRRIDRFVARARTRRMKVIVTLWASPCWASSAPAHVKRGCVREYDPAVVAYAPANNGDFADVARFITRRYGTRLAALELWNEPNLAIDMFWKAPDPAAAYAALVRAAYRPAKEGNPRVAVLAGSLVRPDIGFMRKLYAHGIRGFYDGVSMHPYGIELTRTKLNRFRRAQRQAGDRKGLWITEFGAPSRNYPGWRSSERLQASYIKRAFATARRLSYVRAITLYNLRNTTNDPGNFIGNFGVLHHNFRPKPSWTALRQALRGR